MFPNWARNILFLLVYMISGLVLVIIIEGLTSGTDLTPLNNVIETVVTHVRTPLLTNVFVAITRVSDPFVLTSAAAIVALLLFMRRRRYDAFVLVSTLAVSVVSLYVLKNTFQVVRPNPEFADAISKWSFPSGHATVATTFFFMIAYLFFGKMKTVRNKILLVTSSIIGVALVCFSRLYLGAHWTLDILAGIALGLLTVSFTVLVLSIFIGDRSFRSKLSTW